ncbi:MAG: class 1 fructose-bisphosphatase [Myxococcales bacterium]|nr:class 1 fructose-bisphosphatase [Myxococcales bacterium]
MRENLTTLQTHLARRKLTGDLAGVISAITLATKSIAAKVRRARIEDIVGAAGETNTHGEAQQKLDLIADALMQRCVEGHRGVALYASEEQPEPVVFRTRSEGGEFCVVADPLDGSSNIDVAVSVGTIFSVLCNECADAETARAVLQPGESQLAAGYVLYGSSVVLVLTTGQGVDMYVLDPQLGEFVLVLPDLRIPAQKKIYSINEAYWNDFPDAIRSYLQFAHENGYGSRYIGSMVADVHRTLLKGGVFLYPPTRKAPDGKLRLLYEGNPMAMLVEQAGGAAAAASGRILEVVPDEFHQRTGVVIGSPEEVAEVMRHLNE